MKVLTEVTKCSKCPYYKKRYEFGVYTAYCGHSQASSIINYSSAYAHVGSDRVPSESVSDYCPLTNLYVLEDKNGQIS